MYSVCGCLKPIRRLLISVVLFLIIIVLVVFRQLQDAYLVDRVSHRKSWQPVTQDNVVSKTHYMTTETQDNVITKTYYMTSVLDHISRRLGNDMFSFASLIGISVQNNATPVISSKIRLNRIFQINKLILSSDDVLQTMKNHFLPCHEGRIPCGFNSSLLQLHKLKTNIKLMGYLQSFKYFDGVRDIIRDNFRFKENLKSAAEAFFKDKFSAEWRTSYGNTSRVPQDYIKVGIHIRRGDMSSDSLQREGYALASERYLYNAMAYFLKLHEHILFIVCSDDISWAKKNLRSDARIVYSAGQPGEVDLAILSLCDHVIMTVGSFGWWAAWLANGTTIYYDKWPLPGTRLDREVNRPDYFPPHWIPMY